MNDKKPDYTPIEKINYLVPIAQRIINKIDIDLEKAEEIMKGVDES